MTTFKVVVWRYYGEDGYKKPKPVAAFTLEAIDCEIAEELASTMVCQMDDVFVIVEEVL